MTEEIRRRRVGGKAERISTMDTWRRIFHHAADNAPPFSEHCSRATFDTMCWNLLLAVEAEDATPQERFHALHHLSRLALAAIEDGVVSKQQLQLANPVDVRLPDDMVVWLRTWNDFSGDSPHNDVEVPEG